MESGGQTSHANNGTAVLVKAISDMVSLILQCNKELNVLKKKKGRVCGNITKLKKI